MWKVPAAKVEIIFQKFVHENIIFAYEIIFPTFGRVLRNPKGLEIQQKNAAFPGGYWRFLCRSSWWISSYKKIKNKYICICWWGNGNGILFLEFYSYFWSCSHISTNLFIQIIYKELAAASKTIIEIPRSRNYFLIIKSHFKNVSIKHEQKLPTNKFPHQCAPASKVNLWPSRPFHQDQRLLNEKKSGSGTWH